MGSNMNDKIKSPSALGITSNGDMNSLGKDIHGSLALVNVLWDGHGYKYTDLNGKSQTIYGTTTNNPLGDVYFLKTDQLCNIEGTDTKTNRYLFIDTQPYNDSSKPVGLLPGIMDDITQLNPLKIMDGILAPNPPTCRNVSLRVIGDNDDYSYESQYVALMDLKYIDPRLCQVPGCTNQTEGFMNLKSFNPQTIYNIVINIIIIIIVIIVILKLNN